MPWDVWWRSSDVISTKKSNKREFTETRHIPRYRQNVIVSSRHCKIHTMDSKRSIFCCWLACCLQVIIRRTEATDYRTGPSHCLSETRELYNRSANCPGFSSRQVCDKLRCFFVVFVAILSEKILFRRFFPVFRPIVSLLSYYSGARFTKYLTTILRLSYDNAKVTINLRRTSNLQNSLQWMESFSWVRFTCKIVISSDRVFAN